MLVGSRQQLGALNENNYAGRRILEGTDLLNTPDVACVVLLNTLDVACVVIDDVRDIRGIGNIAKDCLQEGFCDT